MLIAKLMDVDVDAGVMIANVWSDAPVAIVVVAAQIVGVAEGS